MSCSQCECGFHLFSRVQFKRHATAVVAVEWFYHHRRADVFSSIPRVRSVFHNPARGHRNAAGFEQTLGQILVAGNAFGNGAGGVGLGGPDTATAHPMAELYQVVFGKAQRGNAPFARCVYDASRTGAKTMYVGHVVQSIHCAGDIKRLIVDGRHHQIARSKKAGAAHVFFTGPHHDLINPALRSFPCLAETALHARQILQFQRHVFENVARPGPFPYALHETAGFADAATVLDQ